MNRVGPRELDEIGTGSASDGQNARRQRQGRQCEDAARSRSAAVAYRAVERAIRAYGKGIRCVEFASRGGKVLQDSVARSIILDFEEGTAAARAAPVSASAKKAVAGFDQLGIGMLSVAAGGLETANDAEVISIGIELEDDPRVGSAAGLGCAVKKAVGALAQASLNIAAFARAALQGVNHGVKAAIQAHLVNGSQLGGDSAKNGGAIQHSVRRLTKPAAGLLAVRRAEKCMDNRIVAPVLVYAINGAPSGAVGIVSDAIDAAVRRDDRITRRVLAVAAASEIVQDLEAGAVGVELEDRAEVRNAAAVRGPKESAVRGKRQPG